MCWSLYFTKKARLGKLKKGIENLDIKKLNIIPFELKNLIYVVDKVLLGKLGK